MRFASLVPLLFSAGLVFAQEAPKPEESPSPEQMEAAYEAEVQEMVKALNYQESSAELPGGMAKLNLPAGYRYLDPKDARTVVVDLWGNPPQSATDILGMIVPAGEDLASDDSWAIVLSFEEDGYVSDKDADDINYDDLLAQLKESSKMSNEARKAAGYGTMDLMGWAVAPRYDKDSKVLYWAKRFAVPESDEDTLNYDMRVLGRRGVLSLNGIAGISRVNDIEAATPAIVSMVQFNEGHRYADFNPKTDKEAEYSLAGLVLGGAVAAKVAAKAGLIAKIGAVLLAGKKFVVIGVIALIAVAKKLFGRKSEA
ncbi:DUF2167 domain-containing protein [Luteolibacter flavescens]|uniref:DUF2167 domain-containing protein n=1 Tax=Luteolibacter flavescens TaxID=1859460 RepID=A0ABT3FKZ5_9BACT|nr:DUF2167 domain-containing protein [Luteolibacter flavescens]MCW1884261.1 DUF2167 domain-containing protein [Luteolibacter flavescens]